MRQKGKFFLYSPLWYIVGVEVYLHSFLISTQDDGDGKASQPGPFTSTETASITCWLREEAELVPELVEALWRSFLSPPGSECRIVHRIC